MCQKALELDPNNYSAKNNFGVQLFEYKKDYEGAYEHFKKIND